MNIAAKYSHFIVSFCFKNVSCVFPVHMLSHSGDQPHHCGLCSKKFSLKANLKRHMMCHTGENPYACPECPKLFKAKRSLHLHIMSHRDVRPFKYVIFYIISCLTGISDHLDLGTSYFFIMSHRDVRPFKYIIMVI